ncbi:monovalent cation/H+ antiporter complex subunit F [Pontivivens insulae]|uniref:Na(+)/H(+) antiporter subunit F n=1 Tax=Pontivivens insulae TaxID=1639689 RepID=A0A2R8A688_9RHOB|nr:monovalent cation/H+ antiporter complex subunit F [Pontivivens insulae]RED17835.1 multisubunit sodium/proton antiporter MrpF subunit [Pontivivens insulae]SPF27725.1 Na(+)/H(+) antiporter subunit F [Pontivivens insulae]
MTLIGVTLTGPLGWAMLISLALIAAALALATFRLLTGPSLSDRVVALDLISALLVAFLVLFAMMTGVGAYMDVAVVLSLVAFLGTVAFARFIQRTAVREEPDA